MWGEESIGPKAAHRHCLVRVTVVLLWGLHDHVSFSAGKGDLYVKALKYAGFTMAGVEIIGVRVLGAAARRDACSDGVY